MEKKATRLIGFSKDMFSERKYKTTEIKYKDSHKSGVKRNESDKDLLLLAKKLYENNIEFFNEDIYD